jgi:YD repeat-containing protein
MCWVLEEVCKHIHYNQADLEINKTTLDLNTSGWPNRGNIVITTTYTQFGIAQEIKAENAVTLVQENQAYHLTGNVLTKQQIIDSLTRSVTWAYDTAGNRIEISFTGSGTGGNAYTRSLDIANQYHPGGSDTNMYNMKALTSADGNNYLVLMQQKNYLGLLAKDNFGNSSSITTYISYIAHQYDQFLRVVSLVSSEATPLLNIALTRDFNGNILSKTDPYDPGRSYTYDGKARLVTDTGVANTYDQLSNILSIGAKKYSYETTGPGQSQMLLSTFYDGTYTWQYSYDADGNVQQILNTNPTYNRTTPWLLTGGGIQYDYMGNLRQFNYNSGQIDCYWYNANGLRVKKTENYQLGSGSWTTTYTMFEGEIPLLVETYQGLTIYDTQCNIIGE